MSQDTKMTRAEFAAKIKAKYPAYSEMDDMELVDKILEKYPTYADMITDDVDTTVVDTNVQEEMPTATDDMGNELQLTQPQTVQTQIEAPQQPQSNQTGTTLDPMIDPAYAAEQERLRQEEIRRQQLMSTSVDKNITDSIEDVPAPSEAQLDASETQGNGQKIASQNYIQKLINNALLNDEKIQTQVVPRLQQAAMQSQEVQDLIQQGADRETIMSKVQEVQNQLLLNDEQFKLIYEQYAAKAGDVARENEFSKDVWLPFRGFNAISEAVGNAPGGSFFKPLLDFTARFTPIDEVLDTVRGFARLGNQAAGVVRTLDLINTNRILNQEQNEYNRLQNRLEEGASPEDKINVVDGPYASPRETTIGDRMSYLEKAISGDSERSQEDLKDVIDNKRVQGLFPEIKLRDGINLNEFFETVAEQVPRMVLDYYTLGGFSGMQTYTNSYINQAMRIAEKRYNTKNYTVGQLDAIIRSGEVDEQAAIASALTTAALERLPLGRLGKAAGVIKNEAKALKMFTNPSLVRGEWKKFVRQLPAGAKEVAWNSISEGGTEFAQYFTEEAWDAYGSKTDANFKWDEAYESALQGAVVGGGLVASSRAYRFGKTEWDAWREKTLLSDITPENKLKYLNKVGQRLQNAVANGEMSKEEAETKLESIKKAYDAINSVPDNIPDDKKAKAASLVDEKNELKEQVKKGDDILTTPQKERIKQIDEELGTIAGVKKDENAGEIDNELANSIKKTTPQPETLTPEEKSKSLVNEVLTPKQEESNVNIKQVKPKKSTKESGFKPAKVEGISKQKGIAKVDKKRSPKLEKESGYNIDKNGQISLFDNPTVPKELQGQRKNPINKSLAGLPNTMNVIDSKDFKEKALVKEGGRDAKKIDEFFNFLGDQIPVVSVDGMNKNSGRRGAITYMPITTSDGVQTRAPYIAIDSDLIGDVEAVKETFAEEIQHGIDLGNTSLFPTLQKEANKLAEKARKNPTKKLKEQLEPYTRAGKNAETLNLEARGKVARDILTGNIKVPKNTLEKIWKEIKDFFKRIFASNRDAEKLRQDIANQYAQIGKLPDGFWKNIVEGFTLSNINDLSDRQYTQEEINLAELKNKFIEDGTLDEEASEQLEELFDQFSKDDKIAEGIVKEIEGMDNIPKEKAMSTAQMDKFLGRAPKESQENKVAIETESYNKVKDEFETMFSRNDKESKFRAAPEAFILKPKKKRRKGTRLMYLSTEEVLGRINTGLTEAFKRNKLDAVNVFSFVGNSILEGIDPKYYDVVLEKIGRALDTSKKDAQIELDKLNARDKQLANKRKELRKDKEANIIPLENIEEDLDKIRKRKRRKRTDIRALEAAKKPENQRHSAPVMLGKSALRPLEKAGIIGYYLVGEDSYTSVLAEIFQQDNPNMEKKEHSYNALRVIDQKAFDDFMLSSSSNAINNTEYRESNYGEPKPIGKDGLSIPGLDGYTAIKFKTEEQKQMFLDAQKNYEGKGLLSYVDAINNMNSQSFDIDGPMAVALNRMGFDALYETPLYEQRKKEGRLVEDRNGNLVLSRKDKQSLKSKRIQFDKVMNDMAKDFGKVVRFYNQLALITRQNVAKPVSNPQSHKMYRAAAGFSEGDVIGVKGAKAMFVQAADSYKPSDVNIETEAQMMKWTKDNMDMIFSVGSDPAGNIDTILEADDPFGFMRHAVEITRAANNPNGFVNYESNAAAFYDETASGQQRYALITKDQDERNLVNLGPNKGRSDVYARLGTATEARNPVKEDAKDIYEKVDKALTNFDEVIAKEQELYNQKLREIVGNNPKITEEEFNKVLPKEERQELRKPLQAAYNARTAYLNSPEFLEFNDKFSAYAIKTLRKEGKARKFEKSMIMTKGYSAKDAATADRLIKAMRDKNINLPWKSVKWIVDAYFDEMTISMPKSAQLLDVISQAAVYNAKNGKGLIYPGYAVDSTGIRIPREPLSYEKHGSRNDVGKTKGMSIYTSQGYGDIESSSADNGSGPGFAHNIEANGNLFYYTQMQKLIGVYDAFGTTYANADLLKALTRISYYKLATYKSEFGKGDYLSEFLYRNLPEDRAKKLDESFERGSAEDKYILSNPNSTSAGSGGTSDLPTNFNKNQKNRAQVSVNDLGLDKGLSDLSPDSKAAQIETASKAIAQGVFKNTKGKGGNFNYYKQYMESIKDYVEKNPNTEFSVQDIMNYLVPKINSVNPELAQRLQRDYSRKDTHAMQGEIGNIREVAKRDGKKVSIPMQSMSTWLGTWTNMTKLAFGGRNAAQRVRKAWGMDKVDQGYVQSEHNLKAENEAYAEAHAIDKYWYGDKARKVNGYDYTHVRNDFERMVYGVFKMHEQDGEEGFEYAKYIIQDSLDKSPDSENKSTRDKLEDRLEVWNKFKKAKSFDEIYNNVAQENQDGVQQRINDHAKDFGKRKELAYDYYKEDLAYNPNFIATDFNRTDGVDANLDLTDYGSFVQSQDDAVVKSDGIRLGEKFKKVPKNRALNLEFEYTQQKERRKTQMMINTIDAFAQVEGAYKSDSFGQMFEPDDRKIVRNRLTTMLNDIKGAAFLNNDTGVLKKYIRAMGGLNTIMYAKLLGDIISAFFIQFATLLPMITQRGGISPSLFTDLVRSFSSSGPIAMMAKRNKAQISVRNLNALTTLDEFINKSNNPSDNWATKIARMTIDKVLALANFKLRIFLSSFDAWAARLAYIRMFRDAAKKEGMTNAEINQAIYGDTITDKSAKASDLADEIVGDTQNVSVPYKKGKLFTSRDEATAFIRSTMFGFQDFASNWKYKTLVDSALLNPLNKSVSGRDRAEAAGGLAGSMMELAAYPVMSRLNAALMEELWWTLSGEDDEDLKRRIRNKRTKQFWGFAATTASQQLTPVPVIDAVIGPAMFNHIAQLADWEVKAWEDKGTNVAGKLGNVGIFISAMFGQDKYALWNGLKGKLVKSTFGGKTTFERLTPVEKAKVEQIALFQLASTLGFGTKTTDTFIRNEIKLLSEKKKRQRGR